MTDRLDGKVAIVTGAGSGMGDQMARAMHAEGAEVLLVDISGNEEATANELGEGAAALNADVSNDEAMAGMIDRAVEEFGRLDVLCNNAGLDGDIAPMAECSVRNFDRILAVNTRGVFLGLRYGIPAMIEGGGGSIINTASAAGMVSLPGVPAYCASKAAVLGLTRSAAIEYGGEGIRCNAICPGIVRTAMLDSLEENDPKAFAEMLGPVEARTALGRIGQPTEIAAVAVFLASDESSFLTGAALPVDGGYTAG